MKYVKQHIQVLTEIPKNLNERIELIGRVCYKSEDRITPGSAFKFVENLIKNGHESVLEHFNFTVRFITDRGVSHEIVRHRIASYSQESTRYCNYGNGDVVFIDPIPDSPFIEPVALNEALKASEKGYQELIKSGWTPQMARAVLPNALKTEIIMTANLREWRHFLKLRCSKKAHPQMRQLAIALMYYLQNEAPSVFSGIWEEGMNSDVLVEEKFNV